MICLHCQAECLPTMMAKLSNGDPSKCCAKCWQEFQSGNQSIERLREKWTQDRRDEEAAGCFDSNADPKLVMTTARILKANRNGRPNTKRAR